MKSTEVTRHFWEVAPGPSMKFKPTRRLIIMLVIEQFVIDVFLVVGLWLTTRLTSQIADALKFLMDGGSAMKLNARCYTQQIDDLFWTGRLQSNDLLVMHQQLQAFISGRLKEETLQAIKQYDCGWMP